MATAHRTGRATVREPAGGIADADSPESPATDGSGGCSGVRPRGERRTGQPRRARLFEGAQKPLSAVFVAREHNLAPCGFGSVRCRGRGPERGTPKLSPKSCRIVSAGAGDGKGGTQSIGAHAMAWASMRRGSVGGKDWIGGDVSAAWRDSGNGRLYGQGRTVPNGTGWTVGKLADRSSAGAVCDAPAR